MLSEVIPKAQVTPLSSCLFALNGYRTYINFDPSCSNLGSKKIRGLCIFIRDHLKCTPHPLFPVHFIETLFLSIRLKGNDTLTLGCVYRSPNSCPYASTAELCNLMKLASGESSHMLIAGDFNYPGIDWETMSCQHAPDHPANQFLDALNDCFLHQHVRSPTRFRQGFQPSVLDLVITKEEGMVSNMKYLAGLGASDHILIEFLLVCYTSPCQNGIFQRPALYKADYNKLRQQAASFPWMDIQGLEIQKAYTVFVEHILYLVDNFVPKSKPKKSKNLYMNTAALRLRKKKRIAWSVYKRTLLPSDYGRYVKVRNQLRRMTRNLRKSFELKLVNELKLQPKAFWRYTNSRMKAKAGIDALKNDEGVLVSDSKGKADMLNGFFGSVFTREDLSALPVPDVQCNVEEMPEVVITKDEVQKKLETLNISGAPGPDGLHPRVLQELAPSIITPLTWLFNKSLELSVLPLQWRQATVIPIHKKGSRQSADNYRPISLTSVVCKMLESILRDKIMLHLKAFNLLSPHQHGFRPSRSCTTQLLEVMDNWTQAMENHESVDAIYLDFRKAFDSVPHARLVQKIKSYGLTGKLSSWIEAFLSNRTQQVLVEAERSDWCTVVSGVPQGSVLGPLLFILYINDLPNSLKTTVKIFADDSKLYGKADTVEDREQIQNDLNEVQQWSARWQLGFNVEKCKVLHVGHRNPGSDYTLFGKKLDVIEEEKDLGIIVDKNLKFHSQAASAASKANQILGVVRRSFANLTVQSLPMLYKSLVRPHIEYGNRIWGPMSIGDQKLIEKVQRRATKLVPEIRMKPYSQRLRDLNLPSLTYRRLRGDMILMYQMQHGLVEVDQDLLQLSTEGCTRGHQWKLSKPRATSLPRRNFFTVRTVNNWNSLPTNVISAESINSFKSRLDAHWKDIQFITIFDT